MDHTDADFHFRRFQATGDPEHLALVFDELAPRLLLVAHHLTGRTHQNAEDLVQETFVRAIQVADRFDGERPVLPWLIGILAGEAKNQKRRAGRAPDVRRLSPTTAPVPAEVAEAEEFHEALTVAIDGLGRSYREVLTLRLIHGLTPTEIAHSQGKSPDTIKTQLRRGLEMLRQALPLSFAPALAVAMTVSTTLRMARTHVLEEAAAHRAPPGTPVAPLEPPPLTAVPVGVANTTAGVAATARAATHPVLRAAAGTVLAVTAVFTVVLMASGDENHEPVPLPPERTEVVEETVPPPSRQVIAAVADKHDDQPKLPLPRFVGKLVTLAGQPLADTEVALFRWAPDVAINRDEDYLITRSPRGPQFLVARTRTDGAGDFVIEGDWPRSLFVLRAGNATVLITETPTLHGPIDLGEVHTLPEGRMTGQVFGEGGAPLAGARVRASGLLPSFLREYPLHLLADAHGLFPTGADPVDSSLWHRVMQLGATDGNATVLVRPGWFDRARELLPFDEVTTDDQGEFAFPALAAGRYTVVVTAPGHAPHIVETVEVPRRMTRTLNRIRLNAGLEVRGRVFDAQGIRLSEAEVLLAAASRPGAPFHFATQRATTDERGEFRCRGIDGTSVVAAVRRGPGHPWTAVTTGDARQLMVLRLPHSHRLRFRLVSHAETGPGSARVQLTPGFGTVPLARAGYVQPLALDERLSIDERGCYVIEDIPFGDYTLLIQVPGHQLIALNVTIDRDLDESFHLAPRRTYAITVVDEYWQGVRGAEVFARSVSHDVSVLPITATTIHCGVTDADGHIEIGGVPGTGALITALHREYGVGQLVFDEVTPGEPKIQLRRPGTVRGNLTDRGNPANPHDWMVVITPVLEEVALGAVTSFAQIDREGNFRRRALVDGSHAVRAIESLAGVHDRSILFERLAQFETPRPVVETDSTKLRAIALDTTEMVSAPAASLPVAAEPDPAPVLAIITGTVRTSQGQALPSAEVHLVSSEGEVRRARADWNGVYRFEQIADGDWEVRAMSPQPARARAEVKVVDGAVRAVDVTLRLGVFVYGHVDSPGATQSIQFIHQDESGNWLEDPRQLDLLGNGVFARPIILIPGRYQVTPGGLDVSESYPYGHYITVGTGDNFGVAVPKLIKTRSVPHGIVIRRPTRNR